MSNNDPYNHAEFVKLFSNCIKDVKEQDKLENNDDVDIFKNAFKHIAEQNDQTAYQERTRARGLKDL